MAHYEYVKSYYFGKSADVPFRYTCSKCGKEVTGNAKISTENKEVKVSSRHAENLQMRPEDAAANDRKSLIELETLVARRKSEVSGGNYDVLKDHCKCPYCNTYQRWSYSKGKAFWLGVATILVILFDLVFLYFYIQSVRDGEPETFLLVGFIFHWLYVFILAAMTIGEIKGIRETSTQRLLLPEVYFDRIMSPYLDKNGKIKKHDTFVAVDQNGQLHEYERK